MIRGSFVLVALLAASAIAEPPNPPRWQQATNPPSLARVWGAGGSLYGASSAGVYRSTDGGASWAMVNAGGAAGVWGAAKDDLWIVRAKTIHHSVDGTHWRTQELPMLSYAAQLEGMFGTGRERYLFGADRTGVILHSRDAGATWRAETLPVEVARIASVWGSDANDVYAVGARGVVMHSEGDGQWRVVRAPTTGSLEGIWGTSATNIYAVGTNGTILHTIDRGKTWTPRASSVSYTLSSIVGRGAELYVSSVDGAPLRSSDGKSWQPLTAMVRRGHVFAGDRLVVANANEVHFVGEGAPVARSPIAPTPPTTPLSLVPSGAPSIWPYVANVARDPLALHWAAKRYPSHYADAQGLLALAAHRYGSHMPLDPHLEAAGMPLLRIASISGCLGVTTDRPLARPFGVDIEIELQCTVTCKEVTMEARVTISRDRIKEAAFTVDSKAAIRACREQRQAFGDLVRATMDETSRRYEVHLSDQLSQRLAAGPDEKLDAYARYLAFGGSDSKVRDDLAKLLGVPVDWPGFYWNPGP